MCAHIIVIFILNVTINGCGWNNTTQLKQQWINYTITNDEQKW